jgi:hypothetical protein
MEQARRLKLSRWQGHNCRNGRHRGCCCDSFRPLGARSSEVEPILNRQGHVRGVIACRASRPSNKALPVLSRSTSPPPFLSFFIQALSGIFVNNLCRFITVWPACANNESGCSEYFGSSSRTTLTIGRAANRVLLLGNNTSGDFHLFGHSAHLATMHMNFQLTRLRHASQYSLWLVPSTGTDDQFADSIACASDSEAKERGGAHAPIYM